jgi:hypothetical protein
MKRYLFLLFGICACDPDVTDEVYPTSYQDCAEANVEQRAQFILKCIESANPKSDEEPEDWILLCNQMARDTYCREIRGFFHSVWINRAAGWRGMSRRPCTEAETPGELAICK